MVQTEQQRTFLIVEQVASVLSMKQTNFFEVISREGLSAIRLSPKAAGVHPSDVQEQGEQQAEKGLSQWHKTNPDVIMGTVRYITVKVMIAGFLLSAWMANE